MDLDNFTEVNHDILEALLKGRKTGDIDFDFMEFEVLYDDMEERMLKSYNDELEKLKVIEKERLENLDKEQKAQIDSIYRDCSELLFEEKDLGSLKMKVHEMLSTGYDFGGNIDGFNTTKETIIKQLNARISTLKSEQLQKDKENRLTFLEELAQHREAILKGIENMTIDNTENFKTSLRTLIDKPHFDTDLIVPEYEEMKVLANKSLKRREIKIANEQKEIDKKAKKEEQALEKRTKERRAELRTLDLETIGDSFTGFGIYIGNDKITSFINKDWDELVSSIPESKKVFKANDRKEKLRQKNLKDTKEGLINKIQKISKSYKSDKIKTTEIKDLETEIEKELLNWGSRMEALINDF